MSEYLTIDIKKYKERLYSLLSIMLITGFVCGFAAAYIILSGK